MPKCGRHATGARSARAALWKRDGRLAGRRQWATLPKRAARHVAGHGRAALPRAFRTCGASRCRPSRAAAQHARESGPRCRRGAPAARSPAPRPAASYRSAARSADGHQQRRGSIGDRRRRGARHEPMPEAAAAAPAPAKPGTWRGSRTSSARPCRRGAPPGPRRRPRNAQRARRHRAAAVLARTGHALTAHAGRHEPLDAPPGASRREATWRPSGTIAELANAASRASPEAAPPPAPPEAAAGCSHKRSSQRASQRFVADDERAGDRLRCRGALTRRRRRGHPRACRGGAPRLRAARAARQIGCDIVHRAVAAPIRQIADNCGLDGSIVCQKVIENDSATFGFRGPVNGRIWSPRRDRPVIGRTRVDTLAAPHRSYSLPAPARRTSRPRRRHWLALDGMDY